MGPLVKFTMVEQWLRQWEHFISGCYKEVRYIFTTGISTVFHCDCHSLCKQQSFYSWSMRIARKISVCHISLMVRPRSSNKKNECRYVCIFSGWNWRVVWIKSNYWLNIYLFRHFIGCSVSYADYFTYADHYTLTKNTEMMYIDRWCTWCT